MWHGPVTLAYCWSHVRRRFYEIAQGGNAPIFLDDGRIEIDTNVVERAIRPIALNRKNALFAGSDQGGAPSLPTLVIRSSVIVLQIRDGFAFGVEGGNAPGGRGA